MGTISEKLKKLRKERGLTIQAVTEGAGIPLRTYQNYEYGQREISVDALVKLANFYGVSADHLIGLDAEETKPEKVQKKILYFMDLGKDEYAVEYDGEVTPLSNDLYMSPHDQAVTLAVMLGADMVCV